MERPAAPDGRTNATGERRRSLAILGTVVVLVLAVAVAARTVDLGAVLGAVRGADLLLLAAAAVVYAVSWPLRGRRYGDVLAPMGHRLGTGFLTLATFASQSANLVVPARGGDAARAYLLRDRRAVPYATGAASLTVERAFDLLAIGALGTGALAWLAATGDAGAVVARSRTVGASVGQFDLARVAAAAAAVVGLGAVAGLAARRTDLLGRVPDRLWTGVATFGRDLAGIARQPRALAGVGAGSVAIWALDALTAVLVLAAVASTPVGAVLAAGTLAVCAGNLAKVLPLTQGGLGLYEGAFAATVVAISPVAGAAALAAAVLDHALKNAVTLAGGAVAGARFAATQGEGAAVAADGGGAARTPGSTARDRDDATADGGGVSGCGGGGAGGGAVEDRE